MAEEVLTCVICTQPFDDDDVWDADEGGNVFHPSCREALEDQE